MTGSNIYLTISFLVGLAQIVDAVVLWKTKGKLNPLLVTFSKAEIIWAFVSLVAWREIDVPAWLPVSFTAYVAVVFILGIVTQKRIREAGIPMTIAFAGGLFGIYFASTAYAYLPVK